jgi:hypothetical protein
MKEGKENEREEVGSTLTVEKKIKKGANIWFDTPVPVEVLEARMLIEETTVPPAHMAITDHPALANTYCAKIFQAVHESFFINPVWQRPVLLGNHFIEAFRLSEVLSSGLGC